VNRVIKESGVTRVTLYKHFPSKDELVNTYLQERAIRAKQAVAKLLDSYPDDPRGAMHELGNFACDAFKEEFRGCPFINAAAEFAEPDHRVREAVVRQRLWSLEVIEKLLRQLGHSRPERTARILLMLRTGATVGTSMEKTPGLEQTFLEAWNEVIDSDF
jgi:AcrR family transcriptional regulator